MYSAVGRPHLCVFVVTVGGQEHLGYFIHSTQQERQLCLDERERENTKYYKAIIIHSAFVQAFRQRRKVNVDFSSCQCVPVGIS